MTEQTRRGLLVILASAALLSGCGGSRVDASAIHRAKEICTDHGGIDYFQLHSNSEVDFVRCSDYTERLLRQAKGELK